MMNGRLTTAREDAHVVNGVRNIFEPKRALRMYSVLYRTLEFIRNLHCYILAISVASNLASCNKSLDETDLSLSPVAYFRFSHITFQTLCGQYYYCDRISLQVHDQPHSPQLSHVFQLSKKNASQKAGRREEDSAWQAG